MSHNSENWMVPALLGLFSGSGGSGTIEETTGILKGDGNGNAIAAETEEAESIGIDTEVIEDSANLVTSGAVAAAIAATVSAIPTKVMVVTYDDDTTETFNVLIEATE